MSFSVLFSLLFRAQHFVPDYRVVHLDLKGAPPSISYLKELFPLISKAGANALLIEYEDMFPYWGSIVNASALNAYSLDDIQVQTTVSIFDFLKKKLK
jgi:hypothetical protein